MNFSRYGTPSEHWRAYTEQNPTASLEGHNGNDISKAHELRSANNKAREATAERLMNEKNLTSRVLIETIQVPSHEEHTIGIRRYASRESDVTGARVLLFSHGGGLLFGSETTDDVFCATTASENNIIVLSVIYRHTPEFKHPAQHNDAWDAFAHVRDGAEGLRVDIGNGLCVMGVSAGAGLAASVVLRDLAESKTAGVVSTITGVVLAIPWLIHIDNYPFEKFLSREKTAKVQCIDAPVIPAARLRLFSDILDAKDTCDPLLNTALASDLELRGWPRTAILVAGMDPLRDDGLLFATRLKALGTPTSISVLPGVPHGFRRWAELPICEIYDNRLSASIDWAMSQHSHGGRVDEWQEY